MTPGGAGRRARPAPPAPEGMHTMRHPTLPKPLTLLGGAFVVAVSCAFALVAGTVLTDRHRGTARAEPVTHTLAATVDAYQRQLRTRPDDAATWADLGG